MTYGATPDDWGHWDLVLGLSEDLLPVVCEPGLTIAPTSKLVTYGKVPSRFDRAGHVVGFPKWTSHRASPHDLATWSQDPRLGICLQTRSVRAIDVDVDEPTLADEILHFLIARMPGLPVRRRSNANKFLTVIRVDGERPKQTLQTAHGMIEFLGTGQQCLVAGSHPSGARYVWLCGLPTEIPTLTPEAWAELQTALAVRFDATRNGWSEPRATRVGSGVPVSATPVEDPLVEWLTDHYWVRDQAPGVLHLTCPWEAEHTTPNTDPTATSYFLAGTGGFNTGHFRCLHGHCAQRTDAEFRAAVGYADHEAMIGFEALVDDYTTLQYDPDSEPVVQGTHPHPLDGPHFDRDRKSGLIKPLLQNVVKALSDPDFCGHRLTRDDFRDVLMLDDRPFKDPDYTTLTLQLVTPTHRFVAIPSEMLKQAVAYVAERQAFDSAISWLRTLPAWDGVPRIDTFATRYLGVPSTAYSRAVSRYWWTAHAGRVLVPGVQADIAIVLISTQGTGKTSSIKAMVPHPDEYVELSLLDRDEDLSRAMRGKLIGEIAELRGLNSRDLESIKAWISRQREEWVPKYLEFSRTFPRRLVLVGTSNQEEFLADETGNRRFAPLVVGARQDRDGIARDRDQLWAEAAVVFETEGVCWQEAERLAKLEHSQFEVKDPWCDTIYDWLHEPGLQASAPADREFLRMEDVLKFAIGLDVRHIKPFEQLRAGKILHQLGFARVNKRVDGIVKKVWTRAPRYL